MSAMDKAKTVLESIVRLPDQCEQAWKEVRQLALPCDYSKIQRIVVCGMGGSALPTHVILSLTRLLRLSLVLVNDYHLPVWARGDDTLVVLSSYSGSTEEVLSCAREAKKRKCKIIGVTSGGKLAAFLMKNSYPGYIFDPYNNPSKQPRLGIGYGLMGQIGILAKIRAADLADNRVQSAISRLRANAKRIHSSAKKLAKRVGGRAVIVFGSRHLQGNAHIFANQMNETAKTFAFWFAIPEANHHLLEGLKRPKIPATFVFLESGKYSPRIRKRFQITKDIVRQNKYKIEQYTPDAGGSELYEALDVLMLSSFLTFELALSYNEDPTAIPWVDYFKEQLA